MSRKDFERELATLQLELVKMLDWIRVSGHRLVVLFEGRDAAGKGGTIKRVADPLNPPVLPRRRASRADRARADAVVLPALRRPAARRRGNRPVRPLLVQPRRRRARMGFCSDAEYWEFLRSVPEFERMLARSGIQLVKYWFSVSDEEQERRFQARIETRPRWKLTRWTWSHAAAGSTTHAPRT